jgi:hypothetical protein
MDAERKFQIYPWSSAPGRKFALAILALIFIHMGQPKTPNEKTDQA